MNSDVSKVIILCSCKKTATRLLKHELLMNGFTLNLFIKDETTTGCLRAGPDTNTIEFNALDKTLGCLKVARFQLASEYSLSKEDTLDGEGVVPTCDPPNMFPEIEGGPRRIQIRFEGGIPEVPHQ